MLFIPLSARIKVGNLPVGNFDNSFCVTLTTKPELESQQSVVRIHVYRTSPLAQSYRPLRLNEIFSRRAENADHII